MKERNNQLYSQKITHLQFCTLRLLQVVLVGLLLLSLSSCVAQQADLVRFQQEFEAKIAKLDQEKKALETTLAQANQAIQESQAVLAKQKSEVSQLIKARAQFNSELRSLREENLPKLSGELETEAHRLQRLERVVDDLGQGVKTLETDLKTRDQARATQITTLGENVKKEFTQQSKTMSEHMEGFRTSLVEFKDALTGIDTRLVAENTRAVTAEAGMKAEFKSQADLLSDLNTKVGTELASLKQQDTGTQQNLENLTKAMTQLRSGLDTVGTKLGSKVDDQAKTLDQSGGRLTQLEGQYAALSKKLEADTKALRGYVDNDIRTSLQSMAKAVESEKSRTSQSTNKLESLMQSLERTTNADVKKTQAQVSAQDKHVKDLNQSVLSMREVLDSMASMLGKRSDDQMQQVGKLSSQLDQIKQGQSTGLPQLDANVKALSAHVNEITTSVQSVATTLGQVETSLASRLDAQAVRLAEQDRRISETANNSVSPQTVNKELYANVQHLNQLTTALGQLKEVVNSIGAKLGQKVDEHEGQLAGLAQQMQQFQSLSNPAPSKP